MGLAATAIRVAPWALAIVQSGLAYWLLRRHDGTVQVYADLHSRLARVDRALNDLAWGPGCLILVLCRKALPEDALVFRTVTLRNGITFEVALDPRWMDPITDAIVTGESWFLDDYYVLLDALRPGDTVLDLGGHVGTFALAAAALGCRVAMCRGRAAPCPPSGGECRPEPLRLAARRARRGHRSRGEHRVPRQRPVGHHRESICHRLARDDPGADAGTRSPSPP